MIATSFHRALLGLTRVAPIAALGLWAAPASAQNLISNGTFDTTATSPWWGNANDTTDAPADQTLAVEDGRLCVTMTAGGANLWDVILGVSDLALVANQSYHIAFSVSADADRTIKFKTGLGDPPYTDYFIESIPVTTTPQPIDYTYLNLRDDAAAQFQFQIGGSPGKVCVDDVVIEPVDTPPMPEYTTQSATGHPLKDYAAMVKMGTAVDTPIFLSSPEHNAIVAGEFSMITPANSMKMNIIQPTQGVFDFTDTDAIVAWAHEHNIEVHGHPLVWHTQVPTWLTDGTFSRDEMIDIMYAHIDALMGRYAGQFPYWDVVNEAIDVTDGVWGLRPTIWSEGVGPDFMDLAFTRARADDPNATLLYNDYNIEQMGNPKADKVFEVIQDMRSRGIPVDAVGFQGHYFIEPDGTTANGVPDMQAIRDNMARYAEIGVEVHITECDFRIGKPLDDNKTQVQNKFYADLLQVCIDAPNCSHFTVWGLSDVDSWVPSTFPDYDYAHLFDSNLMPKPAYQALAAVFGQYNTDGTPVNPPVMMGGAGMGSAGTGSAGMGSAGMGSVGMGSVGSAGTGSTPAAGSPPPSSKKSSSGCSLEPRGPSKGAAWSLLSVLALLGFALSRRRPNPGRA